MSDGKRREKLSVSPDGRLLAWCDPTGHLTFYDISSGEEYTSPVKAAQCEGYVWAPDGRYVAATLRDGCGQFDVWIVIVTIRDVFVQVEFLIPVNRNV